MRNILKRAVCIGMAMVMLAGVGENTAVYASSVKSEAKSAVKISKKKKTLKVGKSFILKLTKGKKTLKVKWKSSKKSVAKVSKSGKVTALKKGKCTITTKYKSQKYKCIVTVIKPNKETAKEQEQKQENPQKEPVVINKGVLKNDIQLMDAIYTKNENMICSPLSLNMALGMIANGAGDAAKEELEGFLNEPLESYNEKSKTVMNRAQGNDCFKVANSVWVKTGYTLFDSFRTPVEEFYMATCKDTPMDNSTVDEINKWASDNTNGLIPKVINDIPEDTASVVANAVYFKNEWVEPFIKENTTKKQFTDANGNKKDVDMMFTVETNYYENEFAIGFRKYYKNGYYFLAILPKQEGDFELSDLDIPGFIGSRKNEKDVYYETRVNMPKFKYEVSYNLNEGLYKCGLSEMFKLNAFDGIVKESGLQVGEVHQSAMINLDENGTTAAAVTYISLATSCLHIKEERHEINLNRPFAYAIIDQYTNDVLFLGKVTNP